MEPIVTDLRAAALAARAAAETADDAHRAHRAACSPMRDCADGNALLLEVMSLAGDAWKAHDAALPVGTAVTYSGTRSDDHGPGWTVEGVSPGCLGSGYTITREWRRLSRVRLEHLTPED